MVYMKVIINGIEKDYTKEEIKYIEEIYGSWDIQGGVQSFRRLDFLNVGQIAELLKIGKKAVYQRYKRDPIRYPLIKRGTALGIDSDKFLRRWI